MNPMRVTVWNEYFHEVQHETCKAVYPEGIHATIRGGLLELHPEWQVRTATLAEPEHGLTKEVLDATDVLLWWGHAKHGDVQDAIVDRVQQRVLDGMGLIVLHSGHMSKVFRRLMGTSCTLLWREAPGGERERLWNTSPGHPITEGMGSYFELPHTEMYGEHFDIPEPEAVVFISWFQGGEVFRSGCCFTRGKGRIFYFRPGHETFPIYYNPDVRRVLANAVLWARPTAGTATIRRNACVAPLEKI